MSPLSQMVVKPLESSTVEPEYVYVRIPRTLYHAITPDIYGNFNREKFLDLCVSLALHDEIKIL